MVGRAGRQRESIEARTRRCLLARWAAELHGLEAVRDRAQLVVDRAKSSGRRLDLAWGRLLSAEADVAWCLAGIASLQERESDHGEGQVSKEV